MPIAGQSTDVAADVATAVSQSLVRRGYLTTEWWTTVIGGGLSAVLALVHVNTSTATHVAGVIAPALLAALYAITRTRHKSALATALGGLLPQAAAPAGTSPGSQQAPAPSAGAGAAAAGAPSIGAGVTAPGAPSAGTSAAPAAPGAPGAPAGAANQTDPDFVFVGIPPIEGGDA